MDGTGVNSPKTPADSDLPIHHVPRMKERYPAKVEYSLRKFKAKNPQKLYI